jgi:hypothetical protein
MKKQTTTPSNVEGEDWVVLKPRVIPTKKIYLLPK